MRQCFTALIKFCVKAFSAYGAILVKQRLTWFIITIHWFFVHLDCINRLASLNHFHVSAQRAVLAIVDFACVKVPIHGAQMNRIFIEAV